MKKPLAVWLFTPFMLLAVPACEMAADALPVADANAEEGGDAYVTEFSALHSAIPADAVSGIDDYQ